MKTLTTGIFIGMVIGVLFASSIAIILSHKQPDVEQPTYNISGGHFDSIYPPDTIIKY